VLYFRDVCIADHDHQAAAQWTGHARKYFEMIGQAADKLKAHSINIENNFYSSPDYWNFHRTILETLVNHPAARADVLRALEGVSNGAASATITVSPVLQHEVAA
jgi:hypothetical protein